MVTPFLPLPLFFPLPFHSIPLMYLLPIPLISSSFFSHFTSQSPFSPFPFPLQYISSPLDPLQVPCSLLSFFIFLFSYSFSQSHFLPFFFSAPIFTLSFLSNTFSSYTFAAAMFFISFSFPFLLYNIFFFILSIHNNHCFPFTVPSSFLLSLPFLFHPQ